MFKKRKEKFSIRKKSIGVISTLIGISLFQMGYIIQTNQSVLAQENREKTIYHRYVLEEELSREEQSRIVNVLPTLNSQDVDTVYYIYRITPKEGVKYLPSAGESPYLWKGLTGIGSVLLLVAVREVRHKNKKRVIKGLLIITATGTITAHAIQLGSLSQYDYVQTLKVGDILTDGVKTLEGYEFVGYIVDYSIENDVSLPDMTIESIENPEVSIEPTPEITTQETTVTESESNIEPQESTVTEVVTEEPTPETIEPADTSSQEEPVVDSEETSKETEVSSEPTPEITTQETTVPESESNTESPENSVTEETSTETPEVTEDSESDSTVSEEIIENPEVSVEPTPEITTQETTVPESESNTESSESTVTEETSEETPTETPEVTEDSAPDSTVSEEIIENPEVSIELTPEITTQETTVTESESNTESPENPVTEETSEETPTETPEVTEDSASDSTVSEEIIENPEVSVEPTPETTDSSSSTEDSDTTEDDEPLETFDKQKLLDIYSKAKNLNKEEYSEESWKKVELALDETIKALEEEFSSQQEIDALFDKIDSAVKALSVEKSRLQSTVNKASELLEDIYTEITWQNLQTALNQANQQLEQQTPKQNLIDEADSQLTQAIADLKLKTLPTLEVESFKQQGTQLYGMLNYKVENPENLPYKVQITLKDENDNVVYTKIYNPEEINLSEKITVPFHDTKYTLQTSLIYPTSEGEKTKDLDERSIYIKSQSIEIQEVETAYLYRVGNQGQLEKIVRLSEIPDDTENYLIRVTSSKHKEALLPVNSILEETDEQGTTYYRIMSDLDGLMSEPFELHVKKTTSSEVIVTFEELINAIKQDPEGMIILGADLDASDVSIPNNSSSYTQTTFSGILLGEPGEHQYAIHNLKAPLFDKMSGGFIQGIDFKDVQIKTNRSNVGVLGETIYESTIRDVSIQGEIQAARNVGSFTHMVDRSLLENVSFQGIVRATGTGNNSNVGGIAGANSRGTIRQAYADVTIDVSAPNDTHRVGGLVGFMNGNTVISRQTVNIENAVVKGNINNRGQGGLVGGIVGSTQGGQQGTIRNVVTQMNVENGNIAYGYTPVQQNKYHDVYAVESIAQANRENTQVYVDTISEEIANTKVEQMGITTTLEDSSYDFKKMKRQMDYMQVPTAKATYLQAYQNLQLIVPFYSANTIVAYANQLSEDHILNQKRLLSVTPLQNYQFLSYVGENPQDLNAILLHFDDSTTSRFDVSYKDTYFDGTVREYQINDLPLVYTPESLITDYQSIMNRLLPRFEAINYKSDDVLATLGRSATDENDLNQQMDQLYLEQTFNYVKDNVADYLVKVLATDKLINLSQGAVEQHIVDYINNHAEALLLGLSYVQRWYMIDFEKYSLGDLATFHQDFFGKPINTIEWLVSLGNAGYDVINPSRNLETYTAYFADNTDITDLSQYLSKHRQLLTNYTSDDEWFKDTTQAYVVEVSSKERPDVDVTVWNKLNMTGEKNGILPLLTAQEGIFVITTMGNIHYGMYDRYLDMTLKTTDPDIYQQNVEELKERINTTAKYSADFADTWYRLAPDSAKSTFISNVPVWDGYWVRRQWLRKFGEQTNQAILDFFGPIGSRSNVTNNGSGAYTDGVSVRYVTNHLLGDFGASVLSHEMVHSWDSRGILGGYGRRAGLGAELYAYGLLQATASGNAGDRILTLNTMLDFKEEEQSSSRFVNVSPDRFTQAQDLQEYASGMFDVIYLLSYVEGQAILTQRSAEEIQEYYGKMEQTHVASGHAANQIRPIDLALAESLQSVEDLIRHDIVATNGYTFRDGLVRFTRNGYDSNQNLFTSHYAALGNSQGAPGDAMFKRMAFEILAAKGYEDGFIPYASNQLKEMAESYYNSGKSQVKHVTDDVVFDYLFAEDGYNDWYEFKIAQIQSRVEKAATMRPITIQWLNETHTIASLDDLQRLMNRAVTQTFNAGRQKNNDASSAMMSLKMSVYNTYLRETQDFRESIFVLNSENND